MGQNLTREDLVASFPESTRSWLSDRAVASAVNHITEIKKDELAEGLEWDEFEPFLQARAMAHLTRAEYPIAAWKFWNAVWGEWLPEGFEREAIDKTGNGLLGPSTTWDDASIAVKFRNEKLAVYSLVEFDSNNTAIAFSLEHDDKGPEISSSDNVFQWKDENSDLGEYMVAKWPHSLTSDDFDWDALIAARDHAIKLVEQKLASIAET